MKHLSASDLMPLEQYARERAAIRARMIEHRQQRRLVLGPNCTVSFEDLETVRYQIQEMLRAERIFEPEGIAEELEVYNPLIPDGRNFNATLLLEFPDPVERARRLAEMRGLERCCWLEVEGCERIVAIADEDLERENEYKTAAVHFLRYELTAAMVTALKAGAALAAGIDHAAYKHAADPVPQPLRAALLADLD
jgi:Protein of unknown function (DUF3501)